MDKLTIIKDCVCRAREVEPSMLSKRIRKREIVITRQLCHYLATQLTKMSLSQIGLYVGCQDHATVVYSRKTINNLMYTDKNFNAYVEKLRDSTDKAIKRAEQREKEEKEKREEQKKKDQIRPLSDYSFILRHPKSQSRLRPVCL